VVTEIETCSRETVALVTRRDFWLPSKDLLCAAEERWTYFSATDFGGFFQRGGAYGQHRPWVQRRKVGASSYIPRGN
jgi:hypothetical protein